MQHSNKSNPSDSGNDDDLTYFEALLSYYRSKKYIGTHIPKIKE